MRRGIGSWIAAGLVAGAATLSLATPEEAREILHRAAEAMADVRSITATVESGVEGDMANMLPSATAQFMAMRSHEAGRTVPGGGLSFAIRTTGKGRVAAAQPEVEFDVVLRDRRYEWLDHEVRESRMRLERMTRGSAQVRLARETFEEEFFTPNPFSRWMDIDGLALENPAEVDGVLCEVIRIPQGSETRHTLLYLGSDDHLPRKIETVIDMSLMQASVYKVFRDLRVNAPVAESAFSIPLPPGYSEDPTPARVRRPDHMLPGTDSPDPVAPPRPRLPLAEDWELKTPEGETVRLSDLRGKVVVFDFWGTWLPENLRPLGTMQALQERFKDQPVVVYGLNFRERDPKRAVDFMAERGYTYGLLLDADAVVRRYNVRQFPTYYVVGVNGEVLDVTQGHTENATLAHLINVIQTHLDELAEIGPREDAGDN